MSAISKERRPCCSFLVGSAVALLGLGIAACSSEYPDAETSPDKPAMEAPAGKGPAGDQPDSEFGTVYLALQTDESESDCEEDPVQFKAIFKSEEGDEYECVSDVSDWKMSGEFVDGSEGDESQHAWSDCLAVLPAGHYFVEVIPLDSEGNPHDCCHVDPEFFTEVVTVEKGETTEVFVKIICGESTAGAVDFFFWINHPPVITGIDFGEFKFDKVCSPIKFTVQAIDLDGDDLLFTFEIIEKPAGAVYEFDWSASSPTAVFTAMTPGDYTIFVTVLDEHGESSFLSFPLHVVDAFDADCSEFFAD